MVRPILCFWGGGTTSSRMIAHRTTGVVDTQHSPAVLFATVKGAYDMSLKSFILRLLFCISALL